MIVEPKPSSTDTAKNIAVPVSTTTKKEANRGQPAALRRINIDSIVRKIQTDAPISRADLARSTKLSYPTVMKIGNMLLDHQMAEWLPDEIQESSGRGRPASFMQMSCTQSHVIAISFRPTHILAATAGLDGRTLREITAPIPQSYPEILQASQQLIKNLQEGNTSHTLGLGLSVPGQIDTGCNDLILQSPNIPCMEGQRISTDLSKLTQLPTVAVSTMRALYNSEVIRGQAVAYDNFVVLSYFSGMALAMSCNGNYVTGANGMAGELGHLIVDPGGELCGCGNRGCIETLATDLSLSHAVSRNLGRQVEVEEMLELIRKSPDRFAPEIDCMLNYLSIAIGATINIFNPEAIFLYGRLLEVNDTFIAKLRKKIPDKCLKSLASKCLVKRSKSSMIQGAALAIAKQLTGKLSTN